ncbi:L-asparaginase II [Campylobacter lari]|uniref:L-asparaginase, type II n=2 Tax=Campylobacter lari TaxID=201 RepID=A0A0A8HTY1_CAMLA|nr:L-asparaginase, type II [Campylobacter lari]AJD01359.1 L-asparaginase, type II [Campylobacter lari NCTC 11845]EAK9955064.1 L-asparaginase, type II [Campylobacter lari]STA73771.1 L-asparaginase II [Campylobacter lari]
MKISVLGIGGTICMLKDESGGVSPKLNAKALVDSIGLTENINIEAKSILAVPSPSLKFEDIFEIIKVAKNEIRNNSNGIVVTQGTDTLEESAFLLSLLWDEEVPMIVTGAMKNPSELGSDGSSNLYQSILVASDKSSQKRGVLVVFNHIIYQPRFLHKSNSFSLDTFVSINGGNIGYIYEKQVRYISPIYKNKIYNIPDKIDKKVAIIPACLSGDDYFLDKLSVFDGLIINGFGAGHVSFDFIEKIKPLSLNIPCVVTSRTGSGPTAYNTYSYKGSEIDLQNNGLIMGNFFDSLKARILLTVLLSNGFSKDDIFKEFNSYYMYF